jgi:hypothetical protein
MGKVFIVLMLCFIITPPVQAEVKSYVAVNYDTMNQDWLWELNINKHITDWWLVGASMATYAPEYGFKYFIPSWIPHRLDYEVYTELRLGDWSLRVTDWCDHWFSQSGVSGWDDHHGLTVRLKYEF